MPRIEWKIVDFLSISEDQNYIRYASPTFCFANVQWHLRIWPKGILPCSSEFVTLYLLRHVKQELSMEYNLGLKRCDSNVEQLVTGVLKQNSTCSDDILLIRKSDLMQRKSELLPCNIFTVTCTLKVINTNSHSSQPNLLDKTEPLKLIGK